MFRESSLNISIYTHVHVEEQSSEYKSHFYITLLFPVSSLSGKPVSLGTSRNNLYSRVKFTTGNAAVH